MADDVRRPSMDVREANCCKVGRVADEYDLPSIDERLASRWLGDGGDRLGLRDLRAFFDRTVLKAAMRRGGLDPLDGEVDDIYRLLTDDEASDRMRLRARRRLERAGIPVDQLRRDFVSHPTVGAHLKDCLGVDPPGRDGDDQLAKARERVFKLQNRAEAVVRSAVEHLRDTGRLDAGEFDVFVGAQVVCERCGVQYDVHEFLRRGGCTCDGER